MKYFLLLCLICSVVLAVNSQEIVHEAKVHVYRSENPLAFGANAESAQQLYIGPLACAAPEIYQVDGKEYVSSNHNPPLGTQMCRLKWVEPGA